MKNILKIIQESLQFSPLKIFENIIWFILSNIVNPIVTAFPYLALSVFISAIIMLGIDGNEDISIYQLLDNQALIFMLPILLIYTIILKDAPYRITDLKAMILAYITQLFLILTAPSLDFYAFLDFSITLDRFLQIILFIFYILMLTKIPSIKTSRPTK